MYICLYALLTVLNYNACLAFNVHVVNKERETPRVSVLFCTHVTFTVTPLHFWPINDCVANLFFAVTHLSLFLTSSYLHIS